MRYLAKYAMAYTNLPDVFLCKDSIGKHAMAYTFEYQTSFCNSRLLLEGYKNYRAAQEKDNERTWFFRKTKDNLENLKDNLIFEK